MVANVRQALSPRRAARHRASSRSRASSTASASSRRATGTSATATGSTAASSRRSSRGRTSSSRASTRSRPSTSTRWRRTRSIAQVEGDEITLWATCQHPFLVRAEIADLFGVPVANVRIQVPYLGGGFGSKSYTKMEPLTVALARKAGRPVRIQNRVAESMVTTRRHNMTLPDAHRGDRGRSPARPRRRVPVRHRRLRGQRPARRRDRRATPRPARTAGRPIGSTRPASTRTSRRPAPTGPSGRRTSSGSASRRSTRSRAARGSTRSSSAARTSARRARRSAPAESRSTPTSSATSRRSPPAVGWGEDEGPVGRPRRLGRPARRRRAPGLERDLPPGGGRSRGRPRRHDRDGPGAAHGIRADRRRGDRRRSRAGDGARRRHALHARTTARPARAGRPRSPGLAVQRAAADIRAQLDGDRGHAQRSSPTTTSR